MCLKNSIEIILSEDTRRSDANIHKDIWSFNSISPNASSAMFKDMLVSVREHSFKPDSHLHNGSVNANKINCKNCMLCNLSQICKQK